jgi:hypothetical protein
MTSFSVDLDALENAAAGINSTINELQSNSVNQLEVTVEQSGHPEFADSLNAFSERWQQGVENLARDAQAIASRLSFSVQDYLGAEANNLAAVNNVDGLLEGANDPAAKR